ncbi:MULTISPECIES: Flp1 family type IVb pilin [unclassified Paenibacillus]|uniref:Flp1 family type IVb pilin n=1 Tax=unclassified Paenibacillus TaxID=185978 RepID=UPI0009545806|nr:MULTISPECIES: Flp1 family type IVb pilin [unclassified Paenibacillus]ASS68856.1 multidrug transporter [Paenibacillus sp. RUD330]SIR17762.1 Putative Flagellin, Flp1-like, domain [Paenibacillus sp. RU4X]SIR21091.1 Putative Flagellin, Flp1-like, domain [Paenibacillus sp. RU4T]
MSTAVWYSCKKAARKFGRSEDGLGTLEVILIIAVVIIIALLFKDWIIELIKNLMGKADDQANTIFE